MRKRNVTQGDGYIGQSFLQYLLWYCAINYLRAHTAIDILLSRQRSIAISCAFVNCLRKTCRCDIDR